MLNAKTGKWVARQAKIGVNMGQNDKLHDFRNPGVTKTPSQPDFTIRDAKLEDFEAIAEIRNQSIRAGDAAMAADEKSASQMVAEWAGMNAREVFLVLVKGEKILGYCLAKAYSERLGYRCTCETSTFVDRAHLGRGFGTHLKRALIARCRKLGYHHMVAKVLAENKASVAHNLKVGFELVGIQKQIGYRAGRWLDVAILQLVLADVPPYRPELG